MLARILRRTGILLVTLVLGSVAVFLLLAVLPGDPAQVALGVNATPEALAQLRAEFGLDRPLVVQYLDWAGGALRGDLGTSYVTGLEVGPLIAQKLAVSGWLVAGGELLAIVIAWPLGALAALWQRRARGTVLAGVSQLGIAVPSFITALLLVSVFAVGLRWLPSGGWTSPAVSLPGFLAQATLPIVTIGLVQGALLARYVRSSSLDVLGEDYMRTAEAKGMGKLSAYRRHGVRNAAIPVVTVIGVQAAGLLVDTIVVEKVFVLPGVGSLLFDAVSNRDLVLVEGILVLIVASILLITWFADVLVTLIDPRLRRGDAR
ncbi:MAG TPA: ABC transporter permease [Pseudoclavibacter sp.]|nr:ABC transporter permease [Pseudoclavibacter sp.]